MANHNNEAKEAIKAYLDNRAATDELFKASYAKPGKSIDECIQYIMSVALKRATPMENGKGALMTKEEVFGLAVHYFDEDNLQFSKVRGAASVSTTAPASAESKKAEPTPAKKKPQPKQRPMDAQPSLFDFFSDETDEA